MPQQIRKLQEEARSWRKANEQTLQELAELYAEKMLAEGASRIITKVFADRDLTFIKLLAQRLTRQSREVTALLASTSGQPAMVFAQSAGQPNDMGALMKDALARLGGRGGGSKDMAQGGPARVEEIEAELNAIAAGLKSVA